MMDFDRPAVAGRPTLTFRVEGFETREELLFKSFIRLLDHLTHHHWRYQPAAPNSRSDLLVLADGDQALRHQSPSQPQQPDQPDQPEQHVLKLGSTGTNGYGFLTWPLKPMELEKELNRLGRRIILNHTLRATGSLLTDPSVAASIEQALPMRLHQWPTPPLLAGPGRLRLATLLTGKAMSLRELAQRSAMPLDMCREFVHDLQHAGLIASGPAASRQRNQISFASKPVQLGLLDRIRMRLGISSHSAQPLSHGL